MHLAALLGRVQSNQTDQRKGEGDERKNYIHHLANNFNLLRQRLSGIHLFIACSLEYKNSVLLVNDGIDNQLIIFLHFPLLPPDIC